MPVPFIKAMAKKTGKSVGDLEKVWDKAKVIANQQKPTDYWAFVTAVFKKLAKAESAVYESTLEVPINSLRFYVDDTNFYIESSKVIGIVDSTDFSIILKLTFEDHSVFKEDLTYPGVCVGASRIISFVNHYLVSNNA